ncbi:thiamin pyrophosphokinase 1 isoform X2 [Ischnura elegans]|uniref:thiamin pyrophosphokinase 1 isoform X2 n=1 Tax=Ischnura elegans TaxID=197161 RepID=UPI001ED88BE6|nr:thiamin pyrophosphokinase 1 isoform X2 [Ischnura elegans]
MHANKGEYSEWKPWILYRPNDVNSKCAVVVLNCPITVEKDVMFSLWRKACVKVLVDGGANQWYNFLGAHGISSNDKTYVPDFITGDFDSVCEDVLNHFKALGANAIHTPDQNETDFTKALRFLGESCKEKISKVEAVISVCDTSGRFDQIMANINTLFKAYSLLDCPVYLLSGESLTWLLRPGRHKLEILPSPEDDQCKKWCSLIPIGCCCTKVTTTGLKWNLDSQALEFGELVSTSNTYAPDENIVCVDSNGPLVWSMQTWR